MRWLPLLIAGGTSLAITRPMLAQLARAGVVRVNYRGAVIPAAGGIVIVVAALLALAPLSALDELSDGDVFGRGLSRVLVYVLGVATIGLVDDLLGGRTPAGTTGPEAPRGLRGHVSAAARGQLSTGMVKAVGTVGLALFVLSSSDRSTAEYLIGVGVLVLAPHVFNLLDLRPGRAGKAFVVLGAGLAIGDWEVAHLQALGMFVGPALVVLVWDLRERAMLGDVGSNLLGALAGAWLLLALPNEGEAIALALLAGITLYGEFRSISALIEQNPLLRKLDSAGRPSQRETP